MSGIIVITGATSGIGRALAEEFANAGRLVIAIGRDEPSLSELALKYPKLTAVKIDLIQDEEFKFEQIIDIVRSFKQPVEHLIHCAVTTLPLVPLAHVKSSEFRKNLDLNVAVPIFLSLELARFFNMHTKVLFVGSDYEGVDKKIRPQATAMYGIAKSALRVAVEYFRLEKETTPFCTGLLNPGATKTSTYDDVIDALARLGTFASAAPPTPATPNAVAKFIVSVLETNPIVFSKTNWDFRDPKHHDLAQSSPSHPVAKL